LVKPRESYEDMPVQDRTTEFRACVDSIRNRSIGRGGLSVKQPLLRGKQRQEVAAGRSEFSRMAAGIGKDIAKTTMNLGKLAQLAKRKTLFDDRPMEISELTHWIKQDIAKINKDIASLQTYVRAQQQSHTAGKHVEEHSNNVVMLLQSKLATTSMGFKEVLEIRTQNMKENKDRTEQFMSSTAQAAHQPLQNSLLFNQNRGDSSDTKGKGRQVQNGDILALDIGSAEEGHGSNPYMQMQLMEQQDNYIQTRSTAIESIESTIAELGQIFSQLATMVAEQRETVQRIDADTMDIAENVSGAHRELLKYWDRVSSNRTLMLQVFGVLILFFLVFILVS